VIDISVQIQIRRDTAANWTADNPTLANGEWGYETDTTYLKMGDGSTAWTSLAYAVSGDFTPNTEALTLTSTNITNKYVDLAQTPEDKLTVDVFPYGGIRQAYTTDFTVITDGATDKRLNWSGLGLESLLAEDDILIVNYLY